MLLQQGDLEVGIMDFVLIFLIFLFFFAFFGDLILIFEWKLWPPQIDFFWRNQFRNIDFLYKSKLCKVIDCNQYPMLRVNGVASGAGG